MLNNRGFKRILACMAIGAVFALFATTDAKADPLVFSNVTAFQNGGLSSTDLFSNPGTMLMGNQLTFSVDIAGTLPPSSTNTLSITFTEEGQSPVVQTFPIPLFGSTNPPFTLLFSVHSYSANYSGIFANLTVDILGSSPDFVIPGGPNAGQGVDSYTYSFRVAEPVPEPTTFVLLGLGMCGLIARVRSRRQD
jgi:hypothetical protein